MRTPNLITVLLGVALVHTTFRAEAALLAHDDFDYSPVDSELLGNDGGSGFSTPWMPGGFNASLNGNYVVAADSLAFGNLVTSGNHVESASTGAIAGITRDLGVPLGVDGTTRYISFLLRPEGVLGEGAFNGFFGLTLEQPFEPEIFTGKPGAGSTDQYVLENRGGAGQVASGVNAVVGETALVVTKAEFDAGIDTFTLYMNPTPGEPEPASGTVKNDSNAGTVRGLTIYSTGAFSIDEIRVGETFADVTPSNTGPDCSAAVLSAGCWPPSHDLALVQLNGVTDPDGDSVTVTITGISQDEPVKAEGRGSASTCPDGVLLDTTGDGSPDAVDLRCERDGTGNGRVYEISFSANDGKGGTCGGSSTFCVPHDGSRGSCVDDGQAYDSTATCK